MAKRRRRSVVTFEKVFSEPVPDFDSGRPRFHPLRLEAIAKLTPPVRPKPTASGFAQWVYSLYERPKLLPTFDNRNTPIPELEKTERMKLGVFCENEIEDFRLWVNNRFAGSISGNWQLAFVRPRSDPAEIVEVATEIEVLQASRLQVNGQALRCVPDVVLRHAHTGDVIIIERKVTTVPSRLVPLAGWPNLQAQLWAYSWIDRWLDAPNVYLIGQIWSARVRPPRLLPIYPRWRRTDEKMQRNCEALFSIYSGQALSMKTPNKGMQATAFGGA